MKFISVCLLVLVIGIILASTICSEDDVLIDNKKLKNNVNFVLNNENMDDIYNSMNSEDMLYEHVFRMGPILLKFDKEWIFNENRKKYIRIGILKRDLNSKELYNEYDIISPRFLASNTKSIRIVSDAYSHKKAEYLIDIYNIECNKTQLWIDLNSIITSRYDSKTSKIVLNLIFSKDVFFYNPSTNKWWGRPFYNSQSVKLIMFSDLFDKTKTDEELQKLYTRDVITAKDFIPNIINKRTLTLPNSQFYNDKIRILQNSCTLYDMYIEKK